MRIMLGLGNNDNKIATRDAFRNEWEWFSANVIDEPFPIQDIIHEGAKLRTRFLKNWKNFAFWE